MFELLYLLIYVLLCEAFCNSFFYYLYYYYYKQFHLCFLFRYFVQLGICVQPGWLLLSLDQSSLHIKFSIRIYLNKLTFFSTCRYMDVPSLSLTHNSLLSVSLWASDTFIMTGATSHKHWAKYAFFKAKLHESTLNLLFVMLQLHGAGWHMWRPSLFFYINLLKIEVFSVLTLNLCDLPGCDVKTSHLGPSMGFYVQQETSYIPFLCKYSHSWKKDVENLYQAGNVWRESFQYRLQETQENNMRERDAGI